MRARPEDTKPKRVTDTSPFVGHLCEVCKEPVPVSKGSGYWRVDPKTGAVTALHVKCLLGAR